MPKHTDKERREIRRTIRTLQEKGLSQRAIAKWVGLSRGAVESYLAGSTKPKVAESNQATPKSEAGLVDVRTPGLVDPSTLYSPPPANIVPLKRRASG